MLPPPLHTFINIASCQQPNPVRMNEMAKRKLTVTVLFEAAVLSMLSCTPVEATNGTISGCPTVPGCVCVSPSDVTCNGVPAIVTLPLANMGLQEVPRFEGVYEDVTTIDLGNNSITNIRRGPFTSTHFPSLVEIILINNRIWRAEMDAFQVSSLETLDLRENQLQEFGVRTFTRFTGPSFSWLLLEDNQIQRVNGVTDERFTRNFFPDLTIHLSGNTPPCEAEFFVRLCPFLEDGDAMCIAATTEGTELLTIQPDICLDLNMPDNGTDSTPTVDDEPDSNPNHIGVKIGGAVGGVLGILLVMLLLLVLVVYYGLKMWNKKFDDYAQSQQNPQQLIDIPVPPTRPLSSPRYGECPRQLCRVDTCATGDQERIYDDIGFPFRPLPEIPVEESSYDSAGYIFRPDSIPLQPTKQDKQVSILLDGPSEGAMPQVCEELNDSLLFLPPSSSEFVCPLRVFQDDKENDNVSGKAAAEKEGLKKTPSNDDKKEGNPVYLQMIV